MTQLHSPLVAVYLVSLYTLGGFSVTQKLIGPWELKTPRCGRRDQEKAKSFQTSLWLNFSSIRSEKSKANSPRASFLSQRLTLGHRWPPFRVLFPSAEPVLVIFSCSSILKRLTQTQKTLRSFDLCQLPLYEISQRTGGITCDTWLLIPGRGNGDALGRRALALQQISTQKGPAPSFVPSWKSEQRKRV